MTGIGEEYGRLGVVYFCEQCISKSGFVKVVFGRSSRTKSVQFLCDLLYSRKNLSQCRSSIALIVNQRGKQLVQEAFAGALCAVDFYRVDCGRSLQMLTQLQHRASHVSCLVARALEAAKAMEKC